MGEIADAMLSGLFCACCGVYLDGDEPGYPRYCVGCEDEAYDESVVVPEGDDEDDGR